MSIVYTSRAAWLFTALETLDDFGFNGREELRTAGVDIEDFQADGRAPIEIIATAWQLVSERTGDPAIGCRVAQQSFNPVHWQSLGLSVLCSRTLRDALERIVRYYEIITDVANFRLVEHDQELQLLVEMRVDPAAPSYEAEEYGMAAILRLLQEAARRKSIAKRIELVRPQHLANGDFEALFACPIGFGASRLSISFDRALVDEALPHSNALLAQYQDQYSAEYVKRHQQSSIANQVQEELLRLLPGADPSQKVIADALCMSVRKLQRLLTLENTSFNEILRELRMDLAQEYLLGSDRSPNEITYLLGYSDQSNFTRAFKSWFKQTPTQFRESRSHSINS